MLRRRAVATLTHTRVTLAASGARLRCVLRAPDRSRERQSEADGARARAVLKSLDRL